MTHGAYDITLVLNKGNNSKENLEQVGDSPFHFVGSLVPTQHEDLLSISRKVMQRLDPTQLPAVWSYRTCKVVFGIERTILCTFNQQLFDSQTQTISREIAKRKRKIAETQDPARQSPQRFPGESANRRGGAEEGEGDSARSPPGGSLCRSGAQEARGPAATLLPLSG